MPQTKGRFLTISLAGFIFIAIYVLWISFSSRSLSAKTNIYPEPAEGTPTIHVDPDVVANRTLVYTMEPTQIADIPRRKAGKGIIIETGLAPVASYLAIYNQWYVESGGKITRVFAGALKGDGATTFERPWTGLVLIQVTSSDHKHSYPAEGGTYQTTEKSGYLRIIYARDEVLTLLAENGQLYSFDVPTRQLRKLDTSTPFVPSQ